MTSNQPAEEKNKIIAAFDLDGTLYTGHIGYGIIRHHRTHRVKRLRLYLYLGTHFPLTPLRNLGIVSEITYRRLWLSHMGWTVSGWTPHQADKAFAWIAEHYVKPLAHPDILARLQEHQSAGHRAIVLSGTLAPLLAAIGRQLGVDETVGTPLVVRNGRYTGACEHPVCQGEGKASRLEDYLEESGDVLWSQSYAYADSYTDLPLLERVGHPVAVNPDEQLAEHAKREGWEIM